MLNLVLKLFNCKLQLLDIIPVLQLHDLLFSYGFFKLHLIMYDLPLKYLVLSHQVILLNLQVIDYFLLLLKSIFLVR